MAVSAGIDTANVFERPEPIAADECPIDWSVYAKPKRVAQAVSAVRILGT